MSKLKCSFAIDIDVQEIFKQVFGENYQTQDDISDKDFLIQSLYDIINNIYFDLIEQKLDRKVKDSEFYEQTKQFIEIDLEIARQIKQNLKIK